MEALYPSSKGDPTLASTLHPTQLKRFKVILKPQGPIFRCGPLRDERESPNA